MGKHGSLYGVRWRKARAWHLSRSPLCVMCLGKGVTSLAQVVDHIKRHDGDLGLFWDADNWQSLCKPCHDTHKQRQERLDQVPACDADGFPTDVEW